MKRIKTIEQVRFEVQRARHQDKTIGFVPTMGALHAGHLSLIHAARAQCGYVVVSIYVNPTQFGPREDLAKYPRMLDADSSACETAGVDALFVPDDSTMYPSEACTWVHVEKLTETLCGKFRPGHFRGVATVCMKLFHIVGADQAFFGQKDAQQVAVVRRMVTDLNLPLQIVVCPTVREPDGLAMSSRNRYLSVTERQDAVLLSSALKECHKLFSEGSRQADVLLHAMKKVLNQGSHIVPEYIQIVDAESLTDVSEIHRPALAAIAAHVGTTRLIDNCILDLRASSERV